MSSNGLVAFHIRIDKTLKEIMKDGKIDEYDIPEIVLLLTDLIMAPSAKKMTPEELSAQLSGLYDYIMDHYKLNPTDDAQKQNFKRLFDMSVRLALIQPNIKKACASCLY